MADEKISELTPTTTLAPTDIFPVVDISTPETMSITRDNLAVDLVTGPANEFAKNQNLDSSSLSIVTSNVAVDFETDGNAKLTLSEDATLSAPTNLVDGREVKLKVMQDATGGRSLSFNAAYDFAGTDAAVNDAASAVTYYQFWTDGTNVFARKIWEDD